MQKNHNSAIIVAAGSGSRVGSQTPKQFLRIDGREVLSFSVGAFSSHPQISQVVIVTSQEYLDEVSSSYPHCQVILGGETRQDSVYQGLSACHEDTMNVLVHDAARPLLPTRIIDECLLSLNSYEGVAPAIEPADSMVVLSDDGFSRLNRERLRIVQTPQCFRIDILKTAHASGLVDTDEMGLVKQALPHAALSFIPGSPRMMKITQPMDLEMVSLFMRDLDI